MIKSSAAEFKLFREAVDSDDEDDYVTDAPSVLPQNKNYILVDTLTTAGGTLTTGDLSKMYEYYLVETKAPEGYILPKGYFKPFADTENQSTYTTILENPVRTSTQKWNPWVLSGWEEKSSVKVEAVGEDMTGYVKYGEVDGEAIAYDMESGAVEWRFRNDAGVELPSTGGPGTSLIYLLGILLTGFAGAGLMMRKRRKSV